MKKHWTNYARGANRRKPGEMTKLEQRYAERLESLKYDGLIHWYCYEAITFKLARDCRYTPDFIVMAADGTLEAHEVKAFWADDARVKIRVAAGMFPLRFVAMKQQSKKEGGGWLVEEF